MKRDGCTKKKLIDVATKLIWEQSYTSVGVDEICRQAGVTKGSFYFAFPSKSDLTVAVIEEHWQAIKPTFDQIFSSQHSPLTQLEKYCDLITEEQINKYKTFGKICGCPFGSLGSELSTQEENIRRKLQETLERMLAYLTDAVRSAHTLGLIEVDHPSRVAHQLHDFISGVLLRAKIENSPKVLKELKPGLLQILGVGLKISGKKMVVHA